MKTIYFIWICKKCGKQISEDIMGKKCLFCNEWTYSKDCKKEVISFEDFKEELKQKIHGK